MLDAYTVRKAIPRILIAVIGINLSIYLCVAALDVITIIGRGLDSLLSDPFTGGDGISVDGTKFNGNLATSGVLLVIFGLFLKSLILGPGIIALIGSLFPIILIIGLIALAVLVTLVIREALIIFLTVISPIAIALFVLPGTEKYFKKWWDLFIKTLMVYPIIAVLFAMSNAMGAILLNDATGTTVMNVFNNTASIHALQYFAATDANQTVKLLVAIVVLYAPLALVPFAFKIAGGAIGAIMNAASGATEKRRKGLAGGRTEKLGQATAKNRERVAAGTRFKGNNFLSRRANTALQTGSIVAGGNLTRSKIRAERSTRGNTDLAKAMENESVKAVMANDDLLNASMNGDGTDADILNHLHGLGQTGPEAQQNLAMVKAAQKAVGYGTFSDLASVANAGTGTGYADGPASMMQAINRAAGGDRAKAARLFAGARSQAERAKRVDLYGTSFSGGMQAMQQLEDGRITDAQANANMADEVIRTKGPGEIATSRNNALRNLQPRLVARLANSEAEVLAARADVRRTQAPTAAQHARVETMEREHIRLQASMASMYDTSSYASEENQEVLGDVLGTQSRLGPEGYTYRNGIEQVRNQPEFLNHRRELQQQETDRVRSAGQVGGIGPQAGA